MQRFQLSCLSTLLVGVLGMAVQVKGRCLHISVLWVVSVTPSDGSFTVAWGVDGMEMTPHPPAAGTREVIQG